MAGVHSFVARGFSGPRVRLDAVALTDAEFPPTDAETRITFRALGGVEYIDDGSAGNYTWLLYGSAGGYEIRATRIGGNSNPTSGTLDTWQLMSTDRQWGLVNDNNFASILSTSLSIEIRRADNGVVLQTKTITMDVMLD